MNTVRLLTLWCIVTLANFANCEICPRHEDGVEFDTFSKPCFNMGEHKFNLTKKVEERHEVEFECYVKNKAAYSVLWMFNNQLISLDGKVIRPDPNIKLDTDLITKFNLRLKNVNEHNKGNYKCQISTLIAQNLEYELDVLVAPTIQRSPSPDVITLNEGENLKVQCLASGNPQPKLTWSKKGDKADHTIIDDVKSELILENVDQTHADTYSCTANNNIGNPVTSEFQVKVRFSPEVTMLSGKNIKSDKLYTKVDQKEKIKCLVNAYPESDITLIHNGEKIPSDSADIFIETQPSGKQFILTYHFKASEETVGEYKCMAENEVGSGSSIINVTPEADEVTVKNDNFPIYSDAILFEWSTLSGSAIKELNVQYFNEENLNGTNKITKTQKVLPDGTVMPPSYYKEEIIFKDFYELTGLSPNTTYTIRLRVKNEHEQNWSKWSNTITVKTHKHHAERKHKPHSYHHKYHARKQHNLFDGNSNMRYNKFLTGNAPVTASFSVTLLIVNLIFCIKAISS